MRRLRCGVWKSCLAQHILRVCELRKTLMQTIASESPAGAGGANSSAYRECSAWRDDVLARNNIRVNSLLAAGCRICPAAAGVVGSLTGQSRTPAELPILTHPGAALPMSAKYNRHDCRSAFHMPRGMPVAWPGRREFPNLLRCLAVTWIAACYRTIGTSLSVHALPAGITTGQHHRSTTGLVTPQFSGASWLPLARPASAARFLASACALSQVSAQES
jgi:hypothetical protein